MTMKLPYLTADLEGIGGQIKLRVDDFQVDEIPLYPPSGSGTHVYFRVRKVGIPTPAAVGRIARAMGVHPGEIGVAGLKDAQAVTTQWMSLEHTDEGRLASFRDANVRILELARHTNKLRAGHLAGNRFAIRIRGVAADALPAAQVVLEVLQRRGVPNYFGMQRFGARGDTAALGAALVADDLDEFVKILLGRSRPDDPPDCRAARDAFDAGFHGRALERWPRHYSTERRALSAYKKKSRPAAAVAAIDKRMKRLYVSAFQSELFNEVLARRIDTIDRVMVGDLAQKTDTGGVFAVESLAEEQPRAERFEISPTGPVPGHRSPLAEGEPGRIEREVIAGRGLAVEKIQRAGALKISGSRRALRFQLTDPTMSAGSDEDGEYIEVAFAAPSGCYATVALGEIMKVDVDVAAGP